MSAVLKRAFEVAALIVTCAMTAAVVFYIAGRINTSTDNTDAAAWIEALSTFAALVVATAAAFFAARVYFIEERRDTQYQRDLRQFQAARVAAWVEVNALHALQDGCVSSLPTSLQIMLRNASDLPVTNVLITLQLHGRTADGSTATSWGDDIRLPIVPPASSPIERVIGVPPRFAEAWKEFDGEPPVIRTALSFKDTNGVNWIRYYDGSLEEENLSIRPVAFLR